MEFNATFLIAAISFIVFVIIMNFIFYKPIEKIVNERENFIDENYDEAKKNNIISQKLVDDYNKKIEDANFEGKTIMEERSKIAKEEKVKLISEAQIKTAKNISENQQELDNIYKEVKESLQSEVVVLSQSISEKLFSIMNYGGKG